MMYATATGDNGPAEASEFGYVGDRASAIAAAVTPTNTVALGWAMTKTNAFRCSTSYVEGDKTSETFFNTTLGKGDEIADRS